MRIWREKSGLNPTPGGPESPRPFAVVDVGTNAIRMDIAEIRPHGEPRVLDSLQQAVSLGRDTFSGGRIQQGTIEECVEALKGFRNVMGEYGIVHEDQVRAVGTSSILEAENRDAFLDRIYIATGIHVVPLEDTEVNRLTYVALYQLLGKEPALREGDLLAVEVGGGSTKLLLIQNGAVSYASMFRLGSYRVRETLEKHRTPADRIRAVLDQHIQRVVDQMLHSAPVDSVPHIVAIAGDMQFAMSKLVPDWGPNQIATLKPNAFSIAEKIAVTPVDELVKKHRLPYHEAETAGPALLAYVRVARAFKAKALFVTRLSLRQGLLVDEAGGGLWTETFVAQIVNSAMGLGERFNYDKAHSCHVADLAVRLFNDLQEEHRMEPRFEILLRVAAILHEIGMYVSNRSHHKHSMYLIANSDVFGLSREDIRTVALVARYHRRSPPRLSHQEFVLLDHETRMAVTKLAAILRVADCLDRAHAQRIRDFAVTQDGRHMVLAVRNVDDVTMERLALEEKGGMFEEVYGKAVVLRTAEPVEGGA